MAIEQSAQLAGPGRLIRLKPRPLAKKNAKMTLDTENAVYTSMTLGPKPSGGVGATQAVNVGKRKSQDPRSIKFKDGVNANRMVSNTGISTLSQTHVGSIAGKIKESAITEPSEEMTVRKQAKIIPSKSRSQPSMLQSTQSAAAPNNELEWEENVDAPEEFDDQIIGNWARAVTVKDASRGQKRTFFDFLNDKQEGDVPRGSESLSEEEENEVEDNPDTDYEGPEVEDVINIDDDVDMIDQQLPEVKVNKAVKTWLTTSMSVDIMELDEKPIKTESTRHASTNAHLPGNAQKSPKWCSKFLPAVMYWVGNSNYPWTIPGEKLADVCYDIFHEVFNGVPGEFEVDNHVSVFHMVCQRISEWREFFGSTAINVLMMFFTLNDDFKTPNARKEFVGDQLVDLHFMYEDADKEDSPGAFLSEFILCVFAAHLNAIYGYEKIDTIKRGLPGHQTLLALATAAAECALVLACDDLVQVDDASDNSKKHYKIALTLNQATNKMSNTGTAFSSGNWETDTIAYMELIAELPPVRISEIVTRAQAYMKCTRRTG
ncbi:hypothetical protein EDD22DRAFT_952612 [Suillus occidentalis]|nr:hypothetical protein EDD22DRAFT_952612 [Suillus occidentalis]